MVGGILIIKLKVKGLSWSKIWGGMMNPYRSLFLQNVFNTNDKLGRKLFLEDQRISGKLVS